MFIRCVVLVLGGSDHMEDDQDGNLKDVRFHPILNFGFFGPLLGHPDDFPKCH